MDFLKEYGWLILLGTMVALIFGLSIYGMFLGVR